MNDEEEERVSVVVVGAGVAGLACASALASAGVNDVLILEAGDRVGGRVRSVDFHGQSIELGAQWIHGEEGNVALDIAKELGKTF
jgi:protoporphyrinogen oxidase